MKKWQVTTLITLFVFIIGLSGAGWSQRPILDYHMEGVSDDVNFEWGSLRVSLMYRNRGNVDTSLLLVVAVKNANISVDRIEPWIEFNETLVKFHVEAPGRMETYSSYAVSIYPVGNPQNFTITYTIEDVSGLSISGIISHLFLEPHPHYPTQVTYNKTDTNTYELLK